MKFHPKLAVLGSFVGGNQDSLKPARGPFTVSIWAGIPSAVLAALLTPSGTHRRSFLRSHACAAASFLHSSALAVPQQPPQGREDQHPVKVSFGTAGA